MRSFPSVHGQVLVFHNCGDIFRDLCGLPSHPRPLSPTGKGRVVPFEIFPFAQRRTLL